MFVTSIYEEKVLAKVRLIHAEQVSLYNFNNLKEKETPTGVFLWNL